MNANVSEHKYVNDRIFKSAKSNSPLCHRSTFTVALALLSPLKCRLNNNTCLAHLTIVSLGRKASHSTQC